MHIIALLLLLGSSYSVSADVYKCYAPAKQVVYQSTPCSADTAYQNKVDIQKLSPQQQAEAEKQLRATQAERQALDKAKREQQAEAAARWQTESLQREVEAAKREAQAARLEAAEAKQDAAKAATSYPIIIPYPNYGYHNRHHSQHYPSYNQNPTVSPNLIPTPQPNFISPQLQPMTPLIPYPQGYTPAPKLKP